MPTCAIKLSVVDKVDKVDKSVQKNPWRLLLMNRFSLLTRIRLKDER
jgi:hypothetical protein